MKAFIVGAFLFVGFGLPPALSKAVDTYGPPPLPIDAVFRVRALNHSGAVTDGSAVLVAANRLITNCHVTRHARSIEIIRDGRNWAAWPTFSDVEHDLCVLSAPGLTGAVPAYIAEARLPRLGDRVFAVGYPAGGEVRISGGQIKGLYEINNGQLIQVSAPFDHGQSGGALFNKEGKLIGITSFKAAKGGDFHFALPLSWIASEILAPDTGMARRPNGAVAFWERPRRDQPLPVQAVTLEADGKWEALSGVARKLTEMDGDNECTWLTLGRALWNLGRHEEAAAAFRRAAELSTFSPVVLE